MVIGAFPVMKLGVLAVRQIAKPIADIIKARAKTHPYFRNYVCMPPAQCAFFTKAYSFIYSILFHVIDWYVRYLINF